MNNDIFFEFQFSGCGGLPNPLRLDSPVAVFDARQVLDVAWVIAQAEAAWREGHIVAGFVSYEAMPAFEPVLPGSLPTDFPLAFFAVFERPSDRPLDSLAESFHISSWTPDIDRESYDQAVATIRERIAAGEVYQVNYTYRLQAEFAGDSLTWYRQISGGRHGAYSAFLRFGRYSVLSFSPELFFSLNDSQVTTKPMKGTMPRGYWPERDRENYRRLAASEKDRAENLMILDLMRNDLGKIARVGSVKPQDLFEIQSLPTVYQMTSTVTADLDSGKCLSDLFKALFPSGSITGAPKISAMKLIQKLESSPRSVYCGAIGLMYPDRKAVFNVAIRTITIDHEKGSATLGVGGGITWDSRADSEYEETRAKSKFVTELWPEFELLETMRLEDGQYFLLERHMNRLARSAEYFGIPVDMKTIRRSLEEAAGEHPEGLWRARLTVGREDAKLEITTQRPVDEEPKKGAICREPIDTNSPFIFHKTTNRAVYEKSKARFPEAFDVLLMNEAGRYTEFTIGNLVIERNGERMTPPVSEGLLPGVMREELIETGQIVEKTITDEDLRSADAIWLINSVRGWVPVVLPD